MKTQTNMDGIHSTMDIFNRLLNGCLIALTGLILFYSPTLSAAQQCKPLVIEVADNGATLNTISTMNNSADMQTFIGSLKQGKELPKKIRLKGVYITGTSIVYPQGTVQPGDIKEPPKGEIPANYIPGDGGINPDGKPKYPDKVIGTAYFDVRSVQSGLDEAFPIFVLAKLGTPPSYAKLIKIYRQVEGQTMFIWDGVITFNKTYDQTAHSNDQIFFKALHKWGVKRDTQTGIVLGGTGKYEGAKGTVVIKRLINPTQLLLETFEFTFPQVSICK